MKFKPYPRYKDSRIEWLGEVPTHWYPLRFKHALIEKKKTSNNSLNAGSISFGNVIYKKNENLSDETKNSYQEVLSGEFLINPLNLNYDLVSLRTALSAINVVVSTGYIVLISNDRLVKNYIRWLLHEFDVAHMKTLGSGVRQTINFSDIGNSFFLEPSRVEQTQIANFLDRETLRIDGLIEEKNRFIELLKEKRQTLISHIVTKGLDPTVKMKDSGIEWLGKVPEQWDIKKIKYLFEIRKRVAGTEGYHVLSITQRGIKVKDTISGEGQLSMDYSKYQFVEVGDFAMNHMDLLTGYVDISNIHGVTSPDYRVFTLTDAKSVDRYFLYLMQMGYKNKIFFRYGQGIANLGRWRLQTDSFNNFSVPYPNKKEQQQIVDYLDTETTKIDALIQETQVSIELLKEHRGALISVVVTGKIDVREAA